MTLRLHEFCCLAPLRSGCIIIGCYMVVTATMYLIGYFTHTDSGESNRYGYFFAEGASVALIACVFNYLISATLLLGVVFLVIPIMLLVSVGLLLIYTLFLVATMAYSAYQSQYPAVAALFIYAVVKLYFTLVVYSYYAEVTEEVREVREFLASLSEPRRSQFEEEVAAAKQQGLPDPWQAIFKKYRRRSTVDEADEAATTDQPGPNTGAKQSK